MMDCSNALFPTSLVILIGERAQSTNSFFLYILPPVFISLWACIQWYSLAISPHFIHCQHKKKLIDDLRCPSTSQKTIAGELFHLLFDSFVFSVLIFLLLFSWSSCPLTSKYICNYARSNIEAAHLTMDGSAPHAFMHHSLLPETLTLTLSTVRGWGCPKPDH